MTTHSTGLLPKNHVRQAGDIGTRLSSAPTRTAVERKRAELYIANIVDEVVLSGVELPLIFLLKLQNDQTKDILVRMEAAKAIMPYIHRKKPIALESTPQEISLTLEVTTKQLQELDDEQLATLTALAKKLAPPRPFGDGAEEASFVEAKEVLPGDGTAAEGALPEAPGVLRSGEGTP